MTNFFGAYQSGADWRITSGFLAALLLLLVLAGVAAFKKLKPWSAYVQGRPILSANEREFFHRLTRALPGYHVFPQVSFSALLVVDPRLSEKQRFAIRRHFGWKYADFVICQRGTLDVVAVVELDDRTHNAASDRKRDAMLSRAGYTTLRFHSKSKPTEAEIAAYLSNVASISQKG